MVKSAINPHMTAVALVFHTILECVCDHVSVNQSPMCCVSFIDIMEYVKRTVFSHLFCSMYGYNLLTPF